MKTRIFIHGTDLLVVPENGRPFLMETTWDRFIRLVGKEECKSFIEENQENEIFYKIERKLPTLPMWHHITALSTRVNDSRIEGEYFRMNRNDSKTWRGLPKPGFELYVRSNNEKIQFLALNTNPIPTKISGTKTYTEEVVEVNTIGATKEMTAKICCHPEKKPTSEFVLDKVGKLVDLPEFKVLSYTASRKEFLGILEQTLGRKLTTKEDGSVGKDYNPCSAFDEGNWTYRPDIWGE